MNGWFFIRTGRPMIKIIINFDTACKKEFLVQFFYFELKIDQLTRLEWDFQFDASFQKKMCETTSSMHHTSHNRYWNLTLDTLWELSKFIDDQSHTSSPTGFLESASNGPKGNCTIWTTKRRYATNKNTQ